MANLYGVAQPNPPPGGNFTIGNVDIVCAAGAETNIISATAILPTAPGVYYPALWGYVSVLFGATVPTSLNFGFRLNGGADLTTFSTWSGTYVANESFIYPVFGYAYGNVFNYPIGTINIQLSANPAANPITVKFLGTLVFIQWQRATDQ